MKRFLVASVLALAATLLTSETASAQRGGSYSFLPFGFYQPYGAFYGNSIRTPPYFSLNPPVYYGARHSRPYGASPFASPPLVTAGQKFQTRLRTQFEQPRVPTPGPSPRTEPCNPCVSYSNVVKPQVKLGQVRANPFVSDLVKPQVKTSQVLTNPFVETADRVAKKS
jgi:hypothetical protein